jgi:tetratricopeptide (TPR) repeat protein
LCTLSSLGQNKIIDSLKLALKNAKHDTTKCNILNAMIEEEGDDNIWPQYNEQLKQLAEKNIANNSAPKNFFLKQLADALNNFGYLTNQTGDLQKSIEYHHKSLKIRQEIGDKQGIAGSLDNIGFIYYSQGDIPKAVEYYNKSLIILEEIGDKKGIAESLNNIGFIFKDQGDIPKALEYYHKSLKFREEIGDKKGIAISLNNIGLIYNSQGDIPKALECQRKSLKFREEIGDKRGIAESLNNIGFIYNHQGNTQKALEYHRESLKIREEISDKRGIASSLDNIGSIYDNQGDIPTALEYLLKSLKTYEEIGDKPGIAGSLNNLAYLTLRKGQVQEALTFASKGMNVAKELGFPENIKNLANTLKTIFQKQKKYKEAFEMFELEIKMRDSTYNQETQKASVKKQLQYKYETQARELQNEQDKKDIRAAEEKEKQKVITYSILAGFVLVVILALFIFRSYRQKQRANDIITLQKKEVENQKYLIEEKHKEITDSINYAERIQRSFLATKEHLNENLIDYFILFKPKDIVSGDFYWSSTLNNGNFMLATADSTGHGVPGAIMSLLNITSLEKAIETETKPSAILNVTRKIIIERLKRDGSLEGGKDGMDCSLCVYDKKQKKLIVSAANNSVWIVRGLEVIEVKADKIPVGKHDRDTASFTQQEIDLQTGDVIYTLTDGFPDQFGGEKGKKFMSKNLRELLAANSHLPMNEQKEILESTFKNWLGDLEQVDDVTIIGFRI